MGTRFSTSPDVEPMLGPDDAANLRAQFNAIRDDVQANRSGTQMLITAGLAIGTSSKKAVLNAACTAQHLGVPVAVASAETAFTATTHDVADGKEAIFVLSVQNDGSTITITKGSDAAVGAAAAPSTPSGEAKMGEVKISASGAIFNASTDDLDASHLTVTYTSASYAAMTSSDLTDQ